MMILKNILSGLYTALGAGLLTAAVGMFLFLACRKKPYKEVVKRVIKRIGTEKEYRAVFMIALYICFILFRTVLLRKAKSGVLDDVLDGWYLNDPEEGFNSQMIENIIFFLPLMPLLNMYLIGCKKIPAKCSMLILSAVLPFTLSLIIETLQLIFRVGSFQLIDLACNTLGGFIGGAVSLAFYARRRDADKSPI